MPRKRRLENSGAPWQRGLGQIWVHLEDRTTLSSAARMFNVSNYRLMEEIAKLMTSLAAAAAVIPNNERRYRFFVMLISILSDMPKGVADAINEEIKRRIPAIGQEAFDEIPGKDRTEPVE